MGPPAKQFGSGVGAAMKMLLSPKEAACVLGPGGSNSKQISESTGTKLHLSGKNEFYPGTQMQEFCMKGPTADHVAGGILEMLKKLSEETGRISGGEWEVEEGGARVHFVLPVPSAKAVIGKGGENIKHLRVTSGMKVHVEEIVIGAGDLAEQVVSCAGPIGGLQTTVCFMLEKMNEITTAPWFANWAFDIKAGHGSAKGMDKGKGKGKGGKDKGPPAYVAAPAYSAPPASSQVAPSQVSSVDMLSAAVSAIPDRLANSTERSQTLQTTCPQHLISAVIGKGGSGTKEISAATGTVINIRDIEGNQAEKAVIITGGAVGCVSAYLHVISRMATLQEMSSAGITGLDGQSGGAEAYDPFAGSGGPLL
eukprot:TRINITY_DN62049_c0_g1_i1.p1 TRINITY_DN62049_c0_g1~~TRINITY_DN62049_c0_g1_i1.p1  ORF type:complete len:413 (+),score=83.03 TRINITY_DN62049_c0_g1_i1:143-1240(+)